MNARILPLAMAVSLAAGAADAAVVRGMGVEAGGITALGALGRNLRLGFAGSIIIKGPRLLIPVELYLGASVQKKKETENTRLILWPVFLSTRIDLKRPASGRGAWSYARVGLGGIFESGMTSHQGGFANFDPGLLLGLGLSLSISRRLALVLDASYIFAFQTWQMGAEYDGHFIRLGLGLDWLFQPLPRL